ncbi:RNA 2',3'-cyclic phosphodiesterase [Halohasta litorea]|uniref:RNA 2',3'-cyclic phosphodiesterase n=1 Tax=Halohasta litorea TaxID=869891 RepID=A0ABD6D3D0_9EURY|nr:RNA 2',3'-cyclic phosphodiesterase [Halohasta litorea]
MRLFVSVDLPATLAEPLEAVQNELSDADSLRVTDPTQAHVTLKFLGDTDPERVEEIEAAIETAVGKSGVDPFDCIIEGLGVFPSLDYISVVWAGVRDGGGAAALSHLHDAVETELTALGFEAESHEFTPHVTLARMDDARGKSVVQEVVRETEPTVGTFRVDSVCLTESMLTDEGPQYETVREIDL